MNFTNDLRSLAKELESFTTNEHRIPNFVLGKFMVLDLVPPKGKTIHDGIVMTAAMLSYKPLEGDEVELVSVTQDGDKFNVEFPNGKRGIVASKYRGPKSIYKFVDTSSNKWMQIGSNKPGEICNEATVPYADKHLAENVEGYDELSQGEKDILIEEYLHDFFMFGLSQDFAFNTDEESGLILPRPGMVVKFYRRYTPPVDGKKYGNVIITKWALKEKQPNLDGSFTEQDPEIAAAILEAIRNEDKSDLPF
jgi:hypothetical protein